MPRHPALLAVLSFTALLTACSDAGRISLPDAAALAAARAGGSGADDGVRRIQMLDNCDPASFDAVLGAGTCTRSGGLSFDAFIAALTARGRVDSWRFSPEKVEARVGQTLLAINLGGEAHTFTAVAEFGGGIVPLLNQLTGNTTVAPECEALGPSDFIPPGGTTSDAVEGAGTERYMCCIHPWMQTTVTARGG